MATELTHKWLLFENQSADGSSAGVALAQPGDKYVIVSGDLGGGTVQLEMADNGGTFIAIDGGDFTAPLARLVSGISKSSIIRARLFGATTPDVSVEITK